MSNVNTLRGANLVAIIATLIMNSLSNSGIFPNTVGDLGESRAIFFLPDGYVFAIWGVIYTLLIGFVIYQFRPVAAENGTVERVGWWFVISCIGNVTWLVLFLFNQVWLSTIAMLVILGALLMIYNRLQIGQRRVGWQQNWASFVPFSIYLGWISVATIANFSTALYETDFVQSFAGINAAVWAVLMIAVAAGLAITMLVMRRDVAYALVIVWASVGIYARPFDTELYAVLADLNASLVNSGALVAAVIVAVAALIVRGLQFQQSSTRPQLSPAQ